MLGYTVPAYGRLSPADLSRYRRYYCETCHQLHEGFGLTGTLTVNYDMTFNTVLLCGITGRRRGIPAKKAADAALRGTASAAFCMVVLFWVTFGKVRVRAVPPPGRKTRRPVFQPLCHACRMVSSAGAWQKE